MDPRTRTVETPDGRSLHVYEAGAPDGAPIVFHHGTPSAGAPYEPHVRDAEAHGVRLVSFDRAGYGRSSRNAGRSVADVAADVAAIADVLGLDRFATWGSSGGGPHALATAALLGDRVVAVATMASVGPTGTPGLDWLAGMGAGNVREFGFAQQGEEPLRAALSEEAEGLRGATAEQLVEATRPHLSDVDAAILIGELGAFFAASFDDALAVSVDGWVDDDLAFLRPWGFELAAINRPALVVQGRQDLMVPYEHGAWLARAVPGAEARLSEEEGHLTLFVNATHDVNAWLLERF